MEANLQRDAYIDRKINNAKIKSGRKMKELNRKSKSTGYKKKDHQSQQEARNRVCASDDFKALVQSFWASAPLIFKRSLYKLGCKAHCGYSSFVLQSLQAKQLMIGGPYTFK